MSVVVTVTAMPVGAMPPLAEPRVVVNAPPVESVPVLMTSVLVAVVTATAVVLVMASVWVTVAMPLPVAPARTPGKSQYVGVESDVDNWDSLLEQKPDPKLRTGAWSFLGHDSRVQSRIP